MPEQARYSLKDVESRNGKNGQRTWIVVEDLVYDVTDYMSKHPGGSDLIEEYAGKDATSGFNDFGHSSDAKRIMKDFLIGELIDEDKRANRKKKNVNSKHVKIEGTEYRKRRPFLAVLFGKCTA